MRQARLVFAAMKDAGQFSQANKNRVGEPAKPDQIPLDEVGDHQFVRSDGQGEIPSQGRNWMRNMGQNPFMMELIHQGQVEIPGAGGQGQKFGLIVELEKVADPLSGFGDETIAAPAAQEKFHFLDDKAIFKLDSLKDGLWFDFQSIVHGGRQ